MFAPFIDLNGNGQIDPEDIAIAFAIASEEMDDEDSEDTQE